MDKPLSQERLDNKLWHLDVMLLKNATTDVYEEWLEVYSEIASERKRLQAIELERDQYKSALEKLDAVLDFSDNIRTNEEIFIDDPTEINEALDFAYSLINPEQHAINKALEGADTNESN